MKSLLDGAERGAYAETSSANVYISAMTNGDIKTQPVHASGESAAPEIRRDEAWRRKRVETAAYYLAALRGFEPGHEANDWLVAESQIDATDAGRTL
jgi:hypothetical protein